MNRPSNWRSFVSTLLSVSTLFILLATFAASEASAKKWKEDWDGDGNPDRIFTDIDDDGHPETCLVDKNEDGNPEEIWEDKDDDGVWDKKWFDYDGTGQPHGYKHDTDGDGTWDVQWTDLNNDGMINPGELATLSPPEPVPTGPTPRDAGAPDCDGDPDCDDSPTPGDPEFWKEDQIPDGVGDHYFSDSNGNGNPDWAGTDLDQNGMLDESYNDTDDDGHWNSRWRDENFDGQWDTYDSDTDGDQQYDRRWSDGNGDGKIQYAEITLLDPPEPVFPEPFSIGPFEFCFGGPECPDFFSYPSPPRNFATHDRGNLQLTVTNQMTLGYTDGTQTEGKGLVYPAESSTTNQLYIGSLWVSRGTDYIANRDYDADPNKEWTFSIDPDGHATKSYDGNSDLDIEVGAKDGDEPDPFSLYIREESWAFDSESSDDDFVIVRYFIHNRSDTEQNDLRAGLFLDLDIESSSEDEEGAADNDLGQGYLVDPTGIHLGARVLDGDVSLPKSNSAVIHNPTFVWPNEYMLDEDKIGFMRGEDPPYLTPLSLLADDHSLLLAVGPFTLAPAESIEVSFAIVGGQSLPEFEENANRAQSLYNPTSDVSEYLGETQLLFQMAPNPLRDRTSIWFELGQSDAVALQIFDTRGRRVRELVRAPSAPGTHQVEWDARDDSGNRVASGVYFMRLDVGGESTSRTVTVVR